MPGTEDLFTPIHKGLRAMLYHLSTRLQTNDFADVASSRALAVDLEHEFEVARSAGCVLCVLSHHASDEEKHIFPQAANARASLVASLIEDHHDLTRRELEITRAAHALLDLPTPEARLAAGAQLNRTANELFGAYITHMNREERELVPAMAEHFSDGQQAAMQGAILQATPPDRLMAILGWMLPSLNVTELTSLMRKIRPTSPPPVLKAIDDLCTARIDPARWKEVRTRVGF